MKNKLLEDVTPSNKPKSIIPLKGNKTPLGQWATWQKRTAPADVWQDHYKKGGQIGLICGKISGDIETLDIDLKHDKSNTLYERLTDAVPERIFNKLFVQKTINGGYHWIYNTVLVEGNQVLAQNKDKQAVIETRGEGGYIVVYDKDLIDHKIQELTKDDKDTLFSICRSFNEFVRQEVTNKKDDCFDDFNERGESIKEQIEADGWQFSHIGRDGSELYVRPDKDTREGVSASFNEGQNLLFVFTSSTVFDPNRAYNPSQVYTWLNHGGNYTEASKQLRKNGFGTEKKTKGGNNKGGNDNNKLGINEAEDYLKERYEIRANEIKDLIEVRDKLNGWQEFKQVNYDSIYSELTRQGYKVTKTDVVSRIKDVEYFTQQYNPIKEFFNGLEPWDKTDRLHDLFTNYVEVDGDQDHFTNMVKKWFARSVKCALIPRYVNKQALIFVSQEQSLGKTTFLRWLFKGLELGEYYTENPNPDDKDGELALSENMFINFDELATLSRRDVNRLKSFITKDSLNIRKAYAIDKTRRDRICSFIGSTNRNDFLIDANNSRWLTFYISAIKWDKELYNMSYVEDFKENDLRQIWAQAYYYAFGQSEFNIELTSLETQLIEETNDEFKAESLTAEYIKQYFRPSIKVEYLDAQKRGNLGRLRFCQPKDILETLTFNVPDKIAIDVRFLGRELNQIRGYKREKYRGVYGYFVEQIDGASRENESVSPSKPQQKLNGDLPF